MADQTVQVQQDTTGDRYIDGESIGSVFRQRVQLGGELLAETVPVRNEGQRMSDYGLVVRPVENHLYVTPFGERRTAAPKALGSYVQRYGLDTTLMAKSETAGGTVTSDATRSATLLSVSSNGDIARQRTKAWHQYQPGHATRVRMTWSLSTAAAANRIARAGLFADEDGLFFEEDADTSAGLAIVVRSNSSGSPVDNRTAQASWNVDPMDGSGPSGATLDVTKINIYEIVFQWLGAGAVWWFVNGNLVHISEHAGLLTDPYMSSGQLPLSWEMQSGGGSGTMTNLCSSVVSEGGEEAVKLSYSAASGVISVPTTPGRTVMSLRAAATFNGERANDNRTALLPTNLSVSNVGSRCVVQLVLNPSLTGAPAFSAVPNSGAEVDVANDTFTGGTVLRQLVLETAGYADIDLGEIFTAAGIALRTDTFTGAVSDVLSIVAYDDLAGTTDVSATMTWAEVR